MKNFVCIDIGGTAIKYGMIDETGTLLAREERETEAGKGGPEILRKTLEIVRHFQGAYNLSGVCISTAGMVDVERGEIFHAAPLIPNYTGTRFKETIEKTFGLPCEVENDVNCAGLAETVSGAAKGSRITLCLTVGTGIGGCIVIDGKVFHGHSNSACEIGYMHMFDSDFQTLGASSILQKKVAERKKEERSAWSGIRIFAEAKKGDPICSQAIEEMVEILARGIANICYVLNPQVVVLGGGIMAQEEFLKPKLDEALCRYLIPSIASQTTLKMAAHRNDAGMLGAFYHFKNRQKGC